MPELCNTSTGCNQSTCLDAPNTHFCGVCEEGDEICHEISSINNRSICEDSFLCKLNNGTEIIVTDPVCKHFSFYHFF